MRPLRYLLLQMRNAGDPMAVQEVRCFARALDCDKSAIDVFDLLSGAPSLEKLQQFDMLLLGGSGHYSVACGSEPGEPDNQWLGPALDTMREIHRLAKPTFASCWGFQAMSRAMGGRCIHDMPNAELGTIRLHLTEVGVEDPIFGTLPSTFTAQAGHEDHVVELPADAVLLASSDAVTEQAFRFANRPIYCTQFHAELDRYAMMERLVAYPSYIERNSRTSFNDFVNNMSDTPEVNSLLRRFVSVVFGK
jgi:GMP synthase (glutamine-hydrolysing)